MQSRLAATAEHFLLQFAVFERVAVSVCSAARRIDGRAEEERSLQMAKPEWRGLGGGLRSLSVSGPKHQS